MIDRSRCSALAWAVAWATTTLATPLAASQLPEGIQPAEWAAIRKQIEAEVDRDLIAGVDSFARGSFGSEHGLVRTAIVSGDYSGLSAQDNSDGPRFGHSVAIDGDWLAVGAPGTIWNHVTHGTAGHGAVFMFRRETGGWTLRQRMLSTNTPAGGRCGHAVALHLPNLAVGCPEVDNTSGTQINGWMRVWRLNPGASTFTLVSSHPGGNDGRCGSALAISADYIAMGCPTVATNNDGGRVNIYRRNSDTGTFALEAQISAPNALANARFGDSVALSQSIVPPVRLAVGAPLRSPSPFIASGGVHVFERSSPGGTSTWTQSDFVTASNQVSLAYFGQAVALNRNQLVIGAPSDFCGTSGPNRCGRAYRYARSGGTWQFQETGYPLNAPGGSPNGPEPDMRFGDVVALGFDNLIAVTAPRTNGSNSQFGTPESDIGLVELRRTGAGEPSVFTYRGVVRPPPISAIVLAEGQFGTSVDFDILGRTMAVGYPGVGSTLPLGSGGSRRGQVWIYQDDAIFANGFESLPEAAMTDQP